MSVSAKTSFSSWKLQTTIRGSGGRSWAVRMRGRASRAAASMAARARASILPLLSTGHVAGQCGAVGPGIGTHAQGAEGAAGSARRGQVVGRGQQAGALQVVERREDGVPRLQEVRVGLDQLQPV